MQAAKDILDALPPKWDPRLLPIRDEKAPKYKEERRENKRQGRKAEEEAEPTTFSRKADPEHGIAESYRIFTKGKPSNETLKTRDPRRDIQTSRVTIATHCVEKGTANARAGAGIVFGQPGEGDRSIHVPKTLPQGEQTALYLAVALVAKLVDRDDDLTVEMWSEKTRDEMTTKLANLEDQGYIGHPSKQAAQTAVANLRGRRGTTTFASPNHNSANARWSAAETVAREATGPLHQNPTNLLFSVMLRPEPTTVLTGARLSSLTQKTAYQGVREIKMRTYEVRPRATISMERAQTEAEDAFGIVPTEEDVWKSMRHKDIKRDARHFLFRTMHDSYMVGSQWDRKSYPDEIRERKNCAHPECGEEETMEHILCHCKADGQEKVWSLAQAMWERKMPGGRMWPGIGMILSSGLARYSDKNDARLYGHERLYRTLVSESAYLIWKIRCKRVIDTKSPHLRENEIEDLWFRTMNDKIEFDFDLTNKRKYGNKALKKKVVLDTWEGMVEQPDPAKDWKKSGGVLVGTRSEVRVDVLGEIVEEEFDSEDEDEEIVGEHSP
jgi:hypothetical protein